MAVEREPLADVEVREMELADLDQVLDIERLSQVTPWSARAFLAELENSYSVYLVACRGERVVGFAGMWLVVDEAHVTNIAVHPAERGRGIGSLLLEELERRARAAGAGHVTLEVRVTNRVARSLYRRHGFTDRGLRRGYYRDTGEDAVIMGKDL